METGSYREKIHRGGRIGSVAARFLIIVPVISLTFLSTGCQTYQQKNKVIIYWREGNVPRAVEEATKQADKNAGGKDAIIWRLEQGATLRTLGKYQESNGAFDIAQNKMDDYAQKAKVRLGNETAALLSNQANLPYEGRSYDGIMLNTYKALNYLALGEPEKARPELIRAYQRQQEAVQDNQRRIEKTQQEADASKDKAYINQTEQNPAFRADVQRSLAGVDNLNGYADYVNPFTVCLDGLFFLADATGPSDLERAHKSFERVAAFDGNDEYIQRAMALVDDRMRGRQLAPTTFVIFETGCAPVRGQIRIDIPIIFSRVSYVGAAFPTLVPQGSFHHGLNIIASGTAYQAHTVASMDSIIARDFKNELGVVITKTVAAAIAKAAAAYFVNQAAGQQNDIAGFLTQIATAAYQISVNIADTRTWTTLPSEFQICCFPTPSDGKIEISTTTGVRKFITLLRGNEAIDASALAGQGLTPSGGNLNVVYVKSIDVGTPLLISQFIL